MTARERHQGNTNVFEAAEQRTNGWYVGSLGPFSAVYGACKAIDATCVIVGTNKSFQRHVIIDGVMRDSFNSCEIVPTASGKLLVRGWKPEPGKEPGHGDRDEYLLYKKSVHGPFANLNERTEISAGTFAGRRVDANGRHGPIHVYQDDAQYGPFTNMETGVDATGAKYLLCRSEREPEERKVSVIDAHGCIGTFDEVTNEDRKALIGKVAATNVLSVIYGGGIVATHENAVRIGLTPLKRNLVQLVRTKAPKSGVESESIYCNAVQVAGPYESIDDLDVKENGALSYTALSMDQHGVRRFLACVGKVPATLLD